MNIHRHTTIFLVADMMPDDLIKKEVTFLLGCGKTKQRQRKGKEKAKKRQIRLREEDFVYLISSFLKKVGCNIKTD